MCGTRAALHTSSSSGAAPVISGRSQTPWRLFIGLLALVVQLATNATVPVAPLLAAADGVPICHGDQDPVDTPAPDHRNDCTLCPVCVVLASSAALLSADGPALPLPRYAAIGLAAPPPPATAPPSLRWHAQQPRAPPSIA
jgi:hypothetical protein